MRHWLVRATATAVLVGGASFAFAFSTGPAPGKTNAPPVSNKPAESVCSACHNGNGTAPNVDPNGSVAIVGIPTQYLPGQTYPLEIHLNYDWSQDPLAGSTPRKWGFQITALYAVSGDSAGTFQPPRIAPNYLQFMHFPPASPLGGRAYLEHTIYDIHLGENQDGQTGPIVWHFNWVAPSADSGKIYFFAAGNAANGDGLSIGSDDHVYATVDSSTFDGTLGVFDPPHLGRFPTSFDRPYPNPMTKCLNLQFNTERAGPVDLSVFDLQGRRVRSIVHERLEPNSYAYYWDGRSDANVQMKNGAYFIRLVAPGLKRPVSYRVYLAR